jgi:thiol-disulfide isomerase/thioredoxin
MTLSRLFASSSLCMLVALSAGGCSSSTSSPDTTPQDRGVDPGTGAGTPTDGQGTEVNPYGKTYPTENLGYQPRAGSRPGSIMRNYKFLGYVDGDPTKGTKVISLADLFDPETRSYKLISFSAGALWCPPCNDEAKALVPLISSLKEKKVVVIQALIEGDAQGTGSTLADLDAWQKRHNVNYTLFLDPDQKNLGQFFDKAAIPWNAMIDARSMEILSSGTGFNPAELPKDIDNWTKWIDENPAQVAK